MDRSHWRLLWDLAIPRWRSFAVYGLALSFATALPIVASLVLAELVQGAVDRRPIGALMALAGAYAALGFVRSGALVAVSWRATALAWAMTDELRNDLARLVLEADLAFHRDRSPGELVTRADADVTAMTRFFSSIVARVISVVVLAFAASVVLAVIEPINAIPYVVVVSIALWVFWMQRDWAIDASVAERQASAAQMSVAEQYLSGTVDVASLGAGRHGVARLGEQVDALVDAARRRVQGQFLGMAAVRVTLAVGTIVMIVWSSWWVYSGAAEVATVVVAYRFVEILRAPIEVLSWRLQETQGATGSARRVLDLLDSQTKVETGHHHLGDEPLDVTFDGVSLVYDDDTAGVAALADINVRIPAGESLGLVGRTGSGKTTMARLALHLVDPTAGAVRLGGRDVRDLDDDNFRHRVRAVVQDVQLFPGTVRDNVTLFAPAPDGEVIDALRAVGLGAWFDALDAGLDTVVGVEPAADQGDEADPQDAVGVEPAGATTGLSAGEAQLLTLARAVIAPAQVLVLDEATARVDPATQAAITGTLDQLMAQSTTVVIAHRLETLARCDAIAVLEGGRIVEYGRRRELGDDPTSRYAQLLATAAADPSVELEELS